MGDSKSSSEPFGEVPIPSYEEATSSSPPSSRPRRGPAEISDDAERQAFLTPFDTSRTESRRRNGYYQAPSVQSDRSSEDSLDFETERASEEDETARREIDEMDVLDPESGEDSDTRRRRRSAFSKRISSLTNSWSSIRLPNIRLPFSFNFVSSRLPNVPDQYRPGWAILARLAGLFVIASLIYALFVSTIIPSRMPDFTIQFPPEAVRHFAHTNVDADSIRNYLKHVASYDHVAGTEGDLYMARWVEGLFREAGMDVVSMDEYERQ